MRGSLEAETYYSNREFCLIISLLGDGLRRFDLGGLGEQLLKGEDIENVMERFDWREFEAAVAEVFLENGFSVSRNFRFKTSRRYEVDVVASKTINGVSHVMSVDCKRWSTGRYKATGIRIALNEQEERTLELQKFVNINPIAQHGLRIRQTNVFHAAIITLFEENIVPQLEDLDDFEDADKSSVVIPIVKLNNFLNSEFLGRVECHN
jgi:hypothetical protein